MKGTERALELLGMSGEIVPIDELPEGYSVDVEVSYKQIQQAIQESESLEDFEEKISRKQDNLQSKLDQAREQVQEEKQKFEENDKVVLTGVHEGTKGRVNGYEVDRGHVFWHIYGLDGSDLGHIKTSGLEKIEEEEA